MENTIADNRFFNMHRNWEDWLGMALGVLIALSPFIVGQAGFDLPLLNAFAVGILVLLLAAYEMMNWNRWQECCSLLFSAWLINSPFMFGYAETPLAFWHYMLGGIVMLLAAIELWQDWKISDQQMVPLGQ